MPEVNASITARLRCIFCLNLIGEGEAFVGAGAGAGNLFVHREKCYDRLTAARQAYLAEKQTMVLHSHKMSDEQINNVLQNTLGRKIVAASYEREGEGTYTIRLDDEVELRFTAVGDDMTYVDMELERPVPYPRIEPGVSPEYKDQSSSWERGE